MMRVDRFLWVFTFGLLVFANIVYTEETFDESVWAFEDYTNHVCKRPCVMDAAPMVCNYTFTLETYQTMSMACYDCPSNQSDCFLPDCVSAAGITRPIYTINRMIPGPDIQVCDGDTIQVKVINDLQNQEGTSIHWHGLSQKGTPWMDGVARLTQCPITSGSYFTYKFKAEFGTHFYHGHSGIQRAEGLFGALIVRRPIETEPVASLYDYDLYDHNIIVTDWEEHSATTSFLSHHHDDGDNKPETLLINGLGVYQDFVDANNITTPRASFSVEPGMAYRFRVISAVYLYCPIKISVDDHTLIMIASDGSAFEPVTVDTFNIFAGERIDFILIAKNQTARNYWIRAIGLADCATNEAHQEAVLHYVGAPDELPPGETTYAAGDNGGILFNPWNSELVDQPDAIRITDLRSEDPDRPANDSMLMETPDKKFYFALDFNTKANTYKYNKPGLYSFDMVDTEVYAPQINRITNDLPAEPLLTQFDDIDPSRFCNAETLTKNCSIEFCHCIHRHFVDLGDFVELVIMDEGVPFAANHPMHLHGFKFRVVAMEKLGDTTSLDEVRALDEAGNITRLTSHAPWKDTVTIPDGGYTVVRFYADNPGVWFFHCHLESHADIGMGLALQVGEPEEFPTPPRNFPRCGNFDSDEDDEDDNNNDNTGESTGHPMRHAYSGFDIRQWRKTHRYDRKQHKLTLKQDEKDRKFETKSGKKIRN